MLLIQSFSLQICPVSQKVHTTKTFSQAITNRNNSQIIIFDTPGIVDDKEMKKYRLSKEFVSSCRHSIQNSDIIAILHDISNYWTRNSLHPLILNFLEEYKSKPSFLILNKIDKIKGKRTLLESIKALTCNNISLDPSFRKTIKSGENQTRDEIGWPHFKNIFLVSSLKGDGVDKIVDYLSNISSEGSWIYKNNESTDQQPERLIEDFVRARLLDYLPQEIPYNLKVELEYFSNDDNKIFTSVCIVCPNERHEKLVCGAFDGKLKQITDRVTSDLIESFRVPVTLTVCTTVKNKENK